MPFRATFDCLWCGTRWTVRGPDDIEGFAQLCADCVGRAGANDFLRFRLRSALAERSRAAAVRPEARVATGTLAAASPAAEPGAAQGPALLADPDDWYLRAGPYSRGVIDDVAWAAELDAATLWLDGLPLAGEIVELVAGAGWWSPLLASKGTLSLYDTDPALLERARGRLVAHALRAHLHVRDPWAEPDRTVDIVFAGPWLGTVPAASRDAFLGLVRRWLRPGGTFAFVDARPEARSADGLRKAVGADRPGPAADIPADLVSALLRAGFETAAAGATRRFFILGQATA